MAIQTVYQKRKTVGKQVFFSVFGATTIVSFLLLSYIGFTFLENILMSCVVLLCAFGFALISTASVTNKASIPSVNVMTTSGYAAPTAFANNSRHYMGQAKPRFTAELNSCRRCNQVMLSGINTCPKCGWYHNMK